MVVETASTLSKADRALSDRLTMEEKDIIRSVVSRAADKWSLWVLFELTEHGPLRFSRLLERVEGISQKSLTTTLRHLERDGLVTRTVTEQVPIRVDYEATLLADGLVRQIRDVWVWAAGNLADFAASRERYDRQQGGTLGRARPSDR